MLTEGNRFLVSRVQTDGVSNLNVPKEQIYELGDFKTVANVRDIPDLSYDVESFDASTDFEAMLTGIDPTAVSGGQEFNLDNSKPLDITAPFKKATGIFTIYKGLVIPYLTLEQSVYRFGVRANATQQHTLRGDAIYYIPGSPFYQEFAETGVGPYALGNTAIAYSEGVDTFHVLSLYCLTAEGTYRRFFHGKDYTDTATSFTLTSAPPAGSTLRAAWGSLSARAFAQAVHPSSVVQPAAVRAKNIDLYVGSNAATPVLSRWAGVQSVEITRRVDLQNDEEFGNVHYVSQDYETASVSGSIGVKPADLESLFAKISQITGVAIDVVAGPNSSVTLPIEIRISHPDTGAVLKTFYVPDAHLTPPPLQGRVQAKLEISIPFESDTGSLLITRGTPSNFIATEGGDLFVTEGGDLLIYA